MDIDNLQPDTTSKMNINAVLKDYIHFFGIFMRVVYIFITMPPASMTTRYGNSLSDAMEIMRKTIARVEGFDSPVVRLPGHAVRQP
jgi:hypothetical protein